MVGKGAAVKPKQLPPRASARFKNFVSLANKRVLHPLDWQRFYFFIKTCHVTRVRCSAGDIAQLLGPEGFSEEQAAHIASIYEHGRKLLKK